MQVFVSYSWLKEVWKKLQLSEVCWSFERDDSPHKRTDIEAFPSSAGLSTDTWETFLQAVLDFAYLGQDRPTIFSKRLEHEAG